MNTKQIVIVVCAFFLGGILGFIVKGGMKPDMPPMQAPGMPNMMMEKGGFHQNGPEAGPRHQNGPGECRGEKPGEGQMGMRPGKGGNMIEDLARKLDLSDEQKEKIEKIAKDFMDKEKENQEAARDDRKEKISELMELVKKELTDEQKEKLEKMDEERPPCPMHQQ